MERTGKMLRIIVVAILLMTSLLASLAQAVDRLPVPNAGIDRTVYTQDTNWYNGTASDDGTIVKYEWDFDGDGTYDWFNTMTGNAPWVYNGAGTFTVRFRATDNASQTATDTVVITVKPKNKSPAAKAGHDKSAETELPVNFSGTGIDPDGIILKYEWDFDGDGAFDYTGATGNSSHIYYSAGDYCAILRVTDNGTPPLTDTDIIRVTVYPQNKKPVASAGPALSVQAGDAITLVGKGVDNDGAIALYEWDFNGDGWWDWSSSSTGTLTTRYFETGTFTARFRITDNAPVPASDVSTTTVTVSPKNNPPVVSGPSNVTATRGKIVALTVFALDPDPQGRVRELSWDVDSNGIADAVTEGRTLEWIFNSTGITEVKVTASDNLNATAVWKISVSVLEPPAPAGFLMSILPLLVMLLIGLGIGAAVAVPATIRHVKKHWDRYFKPSRIDRLRMRAELEQDELSISGFRGEDGPSAPLTTPQGQYASQAPQYGGSQNRQYPAQSFAPGPSQQEMADREGSNFRQ